MENAIADLRDALRERLAIIRMKKAGAIQSAYGATERDLGKDRQVGSRLPHPIDPRLAHYLQRRSYDKALEFLEQL